MSTGTFKPVKRTAMDSCFRVRSCRFSGRNMIHLDSNKVMLYVRHIEDINHT